MSKLDTVAAIATPPGRGSIGVVRVSGPLASNICKLISGKDIAPGQYAYANFNSKSGSLIDKGVVLYFKAPHSYTGEDVVEFQTHGSDLVLRMLQDEIIALGARMARPGEFTERAFLNDKMDLLQAEAVMDLIESKSRKAAHSAIRSLEGVFSNRIKSIKEHIFSGKALIEAALDFPEEEDVEIDIDPVRSNIAKAINLTDSLIKNAEAGAVLNRSIHVVIAGRPNVGKSSLLNYLAGNDVAIVSSVAGTTRDMVKQSVVLDGIEMMLVDTAGVRESKDEIEQEGISRSLKSMKTADLVLYVYDNDTEEKYLNQHIPESTQRIIIRNKIDMIDNAAYQTNEKAVAVSAKTGAGMSSLIEKIRRCLKLDESDENTFSARQRHVNVLVIAQDHLQQAMSGIDSGSGYEVVGENLRLALQCFDEVLGRTTADDILGAVFSRFCIGK